MALSYPKTQEEYNKFLAEEKTFDKTSGGWVDSSGNLIINSENIKPTGETSFVSPEESVIYPVGTLNSDIQTAPTTPPLEMTESEKQAQYYTKQLQDLNLSLTGEEGYRTEQEQTQDIAGLTKTKQDLANRLKILQNEALAIPLQMQNMAQGRGMTAGGLSSLQNAALRENAVKALSVSALSEAANGNLTTALALVDRAVAAKYDQ